MFKKKCIFCSYSSGNFPTPRPSLPLECVEVSDGQEVVTSTRYYFHSSCLVEVLKDPEHFDYPLLNFAVVIESELSQKRNKNKANQEMEKMQRELRIRQAREMYAATYLPTVE